jgi:hypothetical protein
VVDTGNGGEGPEVIGRVSMVANLENSVVNGKKNTGKTGKQTAEQNLEILQEAIRRCQIAGIDIRVSPFYGGKYQSVVLVIDNVILDGNNLKMFTP